MVKATGPSVPAYRKNRLERLYIVTVTLLIVHQIDAAYWHEWEMFLLPGGVQFFDVFNLLAFPPLLYGLAALVRGDGSARLFCLLTAGLGVLTFFLHLAFFVAGFGQFTLPLSAGVVVACGVSGAALAWQTLSVRR